MAPGELETNHSRVMPGFKLLNPAQNDTALESQDKQTPQSVFTSSRAGQESSNFGSFAFTRSPEIYTLFFSRQRKLYEGKHVQLLAPRKLPDPSHPLPPSSNGGGLPFLLLSHSLCSVHNFILTGILRTVCTGCGGAGL